MADQAASRLGFVCAGIGVVATLAGVVPDGPLPWADPWGIGAAAVALVAFGAVAARRYAGVDRRVTAGIAGAAGGLLVVLGLAAAVAGGEGRLLGPGIAAAAGVGTAVAAYADWRAIPGERLAEQGTATATATLVGVAGLVAIFVWGLAIAVTVRGFADGQVDAPTGAALSTLALGLGTGSVALGYLRLTDRSFDYVDVRLPDARDLGYVLGGSVALVGLNLGIGLAFERLGLEAARHSLIRIAETAPEILLVLIPLAYLIIGPGEELLYRNVVQKSLYPAFSRPGAIVVASAIFAGVHFFAFDTGGSVLATVNTLVVVFVLSLVLGVVYDRTRNVVVSALVHGTFDAIAFAVTYVQITGGL